MLTKSFPFNYMLKFKFSLNRHFEYADEQITYHFWLCLFLRNSRRKSGVGKMNGTVIANRLQNSFKIKDNNVYRSLYYWNFRTSSFKQVACLILWPSNTREYGFFYTQDFNFQTGDNICYYDHLCLRFSNIKITLARLANFGSIKLSSVLSLLSGDWLGLSSWWTFVSIIMADMQTTTGFL
jgi:hypothetical protein